MGFGQNTTKLVLLFVTIVVDPLLDQHSRTQTYRLMQYTPHDLSGKNGRGRDHGLPDINFRSMFYSVDRAVGPQLW